ncbi:probable metallo-hydrolase YflN [Coccomyxa sp. Obi]|nr:probable metallo-hydrolase YflN [Coccomyxa sp. Obi]
MIGKVLVGTTALLAVLAAVTYTRYLSDPHYVPEGIQNSKFEEVAPDLFRFNRVWAPVNHVMEVPISVFLIKSAKDYVLIDAGVPVTNYTNLLINGIKTATQGRHLRMILLTHGHLDHVGSLSALLEAFPKAQLTMHILEAPYVVGGASYTAVPTDNWLSYFMRFLVPRSSLHLPVHRLLYLTGKSGDVAEAKGATGQAATWAPPAGLLEYVHVPGHAPGHVAMLHRPSSSLLPADVITNTTLGSPPWKHTPPSLAFPPPGSSSNWTQHALDWRALALLNFTTAFPSHDSGTGVPKAAIAEFADRLANS